MSLTSYLSGKREVEQQFQKVIKAFQPQKNEFKTISGLAAFSSDFVAKAPNELNSSFEAALVGSAFDYLSRWQIAQKIDSNKDGAYTRLVAEHFFKRFTGLDILLTRKLKKKYNLGKEYIEEFIYSDSKVDDSLIDIAVFYARLEHCWRGGKLPDNISILMDSPSEAIQKDLINLSNAFQNSFISPLITSNSQVIFNPVFGKCSIAVGGADADIYIDGVLYDFKTTKRSGYVGKDVQQLVGYYLFNQINIREYDELSSFYVDGAVYDINRIAIYLARFGEINYIETKELDSKNTLKAINDLMELLNI